LGKWSKWTGKGKFSGVFVGGGFFYCFERLMDRREGMEEIPYIAI
jgi:hypothetical protein